MKMREILPESWWKDLDQGFLTMMGYDTKEVADDQTSTVPQEVSQDIKALRDQR
jgi:hypothetical protein